MLRSLTYRSFLKNHRAGGHFFSEWLEESDTCEELDECLRRCMSRMSKGGGFVLNNVTWAIGFCLESKCDGLELQYQYIYSSYECSSTSGFPFFSIVGVKNTGVESVGYSPFYYTYLKDTYILCIPQIGNLHHGWHFGYTDNRQYTHYISF